MVDAADLQWWRHRGSNLHSPVDLFAMIRNDLQGPASFSMTKSRHRARGFTLVEIAIVLVIIGLLLAGILNAQSVIRNARTKDTIKAMTDMANAAQQFHDRYGAWPGTLQTAVTAIPNMTATCVGNATGLIASARRVGVCQ
jgi:prepilin-type N-terminal cleavage/methylation domain-containing protein